MHQCIYSCQVMINDCFEIPCHKPLVEKVIAAYVKPVVKRVIVIKEKVLVLGIINVGVEYVARVDDCSQPVHFASFSLKFSCFIEVPHAKPGMEADVCPEIEYYEVMAVGEKVVSILVVVKTVLVHLCHARHCNVLDNPPVCGPGGSHSSSGNQRYVEDCAQKDVGASVGQSVVDESKLNVYVQVHPENIEVVDTNFSDKYCRSYNSCDLC